MARKEPGRVLDSEMKATAGSEYASSYFSVNGQPKTFVMKALAMLFNFSRVED